MLDLLDGVAGGRSDVRFVFFQEFELSDAAPAAHGLHLFQDTCEKTGRISKVTIDGDDKDIEKCNAKKIKATAVA